MTGKEVQRKSLPGIRNNLYHVELYNSPTFKGQKLLNINRFMQFSLFMRIAYKAVSRALRIIIVRYFICSSTHVFYSYRESERISNQCKQRKIDHLGMEDPLNGCVLQKPNTPVICLSQCMWFGWLCCINSMPLCCK